VKIERKMSHLNIAFERFASIGTVMHYILVISVQFWVAHIVSPRTLVLFVFYLYSVCLIANVYCICFDYLYARTSSFTYH